MELKKLSPKILDELTMAGRNSPRTRQHLNLHASPSDLCQRLLNAIEVGSYIRPHRHLLDPKPETLIAARGLFGVVAFGDGGEVLETFCLGTEKYFGEKQVNVGVEIAADVWHTVLGLVPGSVLLEFKPGPFDASAAKEVAPWAPEEGSHEALEFLTVLHGFFVDPASPDGARSIGVHSREE